MISTWKLIEEIEVLRKENDELKEKLSKYERREEYIPSWNLK
jgi:regulator of replication initiation timing